MYVSNRLRNNNVSNEVENKKIASLQTDEGLSKWIIAYPSITYWGNRCAMLKRAIFDDLSLVYC